MKNKIKKERNTGITLIALVITIIVLLILAAVSIATLTGENGLLNRAQKASLETEKARVLEDIKLAYTDIYAGMAENLKFETITMGMVKSKLLESYGYTDEQLPMVAMENISDITLSSNEVELQPNETTSVAVTLGDGTGQTYFALIRGKYYQINLTNSDITLGEGQDNLPTGGEIVDSITIEITSGDEIINAEIEGTKITITAKEGQIGSAIIKVSYKNITKNISVIVKKEPATPGEINAKIGEIVEYEISTEASNDVKQAIGDWRVFYASNDEMFLISSKTIDSTKAFGIPLRGKNSSKDYTGAEDVFATRYGATYNGMWKATGSTDTEIRSKATAYLCDSKNWTDYVGNTAPAGTYAVGGPTKELLVLSWNQAVDNGGETAPGKKVEWQEDDVNTGGYIFNKPEALYKGDPILTTILPDTKNKKGLYNNNDIYWLASPCADVTNPINVCFVSNGGFVYGGGVISTDKQTYVPCGIRPLVSIPMSKVYIIDGKITIGNN